MKKIITVLLIFVEFFILPVEVFSSEMITDEFAENYLKNSRSEVFPNNQPITDEFAQSYLTDKNKKEIKKVKITDEFAINQLKDKSSNVLPNKNYDYTSLERIILYIKPERNISSKKRFYEGMSVNFYTQNDVTINSVLIPKNSIITGRLETVSKNQFRGVAGEIIVDNFYLKENPNIRFYGKIDKTGANRALWVYPVSIVFMPFFFSGFLLWNIKGGHAKIKKNKTFEIYYDENN